MWNNKLNFEPTNSPKLNETFKSTPVENLSTKKEMLCSLWISIEFADQLDKMFTEIEASTVEIMERSSDMIASNNKIKKWSDLLKNKERKRIHRSLIDNAA